MSSYAMENPQEAERLESKTDARLALEQLALVGLAEGMTVLDAGSGTGAVARALTSRCCPRPAGVNCMARLRCFFNVGRCKTRMRRIAIVFFTSRNRTSVGSIL